MISMNLLMPPPGATDGVMALLTLLADADRTKKMLSELASARDEAVAAAKNLGDLKQRSDELDSRVAALTKAEANLADARRDLQSQRDELASERADHAADVERHLRAVEQLAADRAVHERAVQQHRASVAALRGALGSA